MGLKRSLDATARRTVRRAVTWRPKVQGREVIDIRQLISPLRYDVQVRADFFEFLEGRDVHEPLAELTQAALATSYATWFWKVAMPRFRPWVVASEELAREQFALRVRLARELQQSFAQHGFQHGSPVILRSTRGVQVADSGVRVHRTLHVGDGSHRLALLLQKRQALEPWMYRIDPRPMPVLDNTVRLWQPRDITDPGYLDFVARGFLPAQAVTGETWTVNDLVERVTDEAGPAAADELSSVLEVHARAWGQRAVSA